jgi:hypothetical protein
MNAGARQEALIHALDPLDAACLCPRRTSWKLLGVFGYVVTGS